MQREGGNLNVCDHVTEGNLKRLQPGGVHGVAFWERQNHGDSENVGDCQWLGRGQRQRGAGGLESLFRAMRRLCVLL